MDTYLVIPPIFYFDVIPEDICNIIINLLDINELKDLYNINIFVSILNKSSFWIKLFSNRLPLMNIQILKHNNLFREIFLDIPSVYSLMITFIIRYNTYIKISKHYDDLIKKYYYGNGIYYDQFEFGPIERKVIELLNKSSREYNLCTTAFITCKYFQGSLVDGQIEIIFYYKIINDKYFEPFSVKMSIDDFTLIKMCGYLNTLELKPELLSLLIL